MEFIQSWLGSWRKSAKFSTLLVSSHCKESAYNSPGFAITVASCQALCHSNVLTLASYSKVTNPGFMRYNLHVVLYRFPPWFGCLECIFVGFVSFYISICTYLRDRTRDSVHNTGIALHIFILKIYKCKGLKLVWFVKYFLL